MSSVVSRLQICQPRWRWFPRWRYAVRCVAQETDDYIESLEARVQKLEAERDRLRKAASSAWSILCDVNPEEGLSSRDVDELSRAVNLLAGALDGGGEG